MHISCGRVSSPTAPRNDRQDTHTRSERHVQRRHVFPIDTLYTAAVTQPQQKGNPIIFTYRPLTGCNKTVPDRLEKRTALRVAGEIFIVRSFHIVHVAIMPAVSAHKRNVDKPVTAERDGVIYTWTVWKITNKRRGHKSLKTKRKEIFAVRRHCPFFSTSNPFSHQVPGFRSVPGLTAVIWKFDRSALFG